MADDARPLISRLRTLGDRFRAISTGSVKVGGKKSMQDAVNAARDASLCYEAVKWMEEHG